MDKEPNLMEQYLKLYPPKKIIKIDNETQENALKARNRKINGLTIERKLDLHGDTIGSALNQLENFLQKAGREGCEKVLIVHGKGLHSPGNKAVLKEAVLEALQASPLVRKIGRASPKDGGSGATWAVLK
ncbi:MAG: Smr/MutS family protein [Spirochaetaceae bacterium]|nr:Smr/MutS family protein [Spirochaetaceae bacterium]